MKTILIDKLLQIKCNNCLNYPKLNFYTHAYVCNCHNLFIDNNYPITISFKLNINYHIYEYFTSSNEILNIKYNYKNVFKLNLDQFIILNKNDNFPNNLIKLISIN